MPLQTKSKAQFLSDIITAWAGRLGFTPYLPSGDPFRAVFEAYTHAGFLFLQNQIVRVFKLSRAATSEKEDLDSFMADFSFPRKPAIKAQGQVQLRLRAVVSTNVLVPPGSVIQTVDSSIRYEIIEDVNMPTWSVADNAYVLVAGQLLMNVTVRALVAGKASNVQVGALQQIASSIPPIAFATNLAAIQNGDDAEEDQAYRDRFKLSINAVNKRTTPLGYFSAAMDVPGVKAVAIIENEDPNGLFRKCFVWLVVDDGSGSPSNDLLNMVRAQVADTWAPSRGGGVQVLVTGPLKHMAALALTVRVDPDATSAAEVRSNVKVALINYVNSLSIGETLYLQNLVAVAKAADSRVIAVGTNSVTIDTAEADYVPTRSTVVRTDSTMVTVGEF